MRDILVRARRRAGRFLREWIPYNLLYRPQGVYANSRQLASTPGNGVAYFAVVPDYTSHLHVPDDFYARATTYAGTHGKPYRQEQVPAAFVIELVDGRVYADNFNSVAIITADNYLVGDVSFQYDGQCWDTTPPEANNIFRQKYFRKPVYLSGTVCSLLSGGGAASGNYYHWLIDSLPRLHLLREAGLLGAVNYFLVYDKTKSFVLETMATLGIRADQLVDIRDNPHVQARCLLATSGVRGNLTHTPPWACTFLRSILLPAPTVTRTFSPYIYISRRDAAGRHILNEPALEAMLQEYGFETHVLTPYAQAEKIALFAQAQIIIASVGAGLANLVVSPPGAQLIELFPESFVVADYMEFTARLGISHQYLICASPKSSSHRMHAQLDNLTVDLDALRALVEKAVVNCHANQSSPRPQPQSVVP